MSQKCKFCFLLYLKEIYAQFVETNVLVKHNIYHELKLTIMDSDLQITWKHPVVRMNTNISLSLHTLAVATLDGDGGMSQLQAPGPGSDKGARLVPAAL